jgi:pilus assembly protein CpaF
MPLTDWIRRERAGGAQLLSATPRDLRQMIRTEVFDRINPSELLARLQMDVTGVRREITEQVDTVVAEKGVLLTDELRGDLQAYILDEILGLGPLQSLLQDSTVEEVMVNAHDDIWVARRGARGGVRLERLDDVTFDDDAHVMRIIERILSPIGRRVDEANPRVDARLLDGSRVNVIIPPLALDGPTITIRKFPESFLTMDDLINRFHSITQEAANLLQLCVQGRMNCIISGGTGSGKTTLLNALSGYVGDNERIVTIEDTAELQVNRYKPHVVRLESRPPNIEGRGEVTIRDLVINALRMRPDRIIVGECRGGEAVDMLQAMNTGHDGSLTTVHANSPSEAVFRLEAMYLMSGLQVPIFAIRQLISMAINIIVQQRRFPDGSRRITNISEVTGMEEERVGLQDIYALHDDRLVYTGAHMTSEHVEKLHQLLGTLPRWPMLQGGS